MDQEVPKVVSFMDLCVDIVIQDMIKMLILR